MKRLPFFAIIVLSLTITACQKESPKEFEAILEEQTLAKEIQELASQLNVEVLDVLANKRETNICGGESFTGALAAFVEANQEKANMICQIVRGPVSGCHEGYMTYGSALVFPQEDKCPSYKKPHFNSIHSE